MRKDHFDESVAIGRSNLEAVELLRCHCRHARLELVHGNSMVGDAMGLPMGLMNVRCEYAPPATSSGHVALDLAIEFYGQNCVGCAYRAPNGHVPNLKTVADERAKEVARLQELAQRMAAERAQRYNDRRERRRRAVASEGYVIRDLVQQLDELDAPAPRTASRSDAEENAGRHVIEAARHAPTLFSVPLVDSLVGLARDTAEPAALVALVALVRNGRLTSRHAVECAFGALVTQAEPEAAKLLLLFSDQLTSADLAPVLDRLIEMSAAQNEPWGVEPVAEGLLAAAATDLVAITNRIIQLLGSDEELARGSAADAAAYLLREDARRVIALGPALVTSIRGEDRGYAGEPHPASSAVKALAEAWRTEPMLTKSIVEANGPSLSDDARPLLMRTIRFIRRWQEPWDADDVAGATAVTFCLDRLTTDWGSETADEASQQLEVLSREVPHLLAQRADALVGIVLAMTTPEVAPSPSVSRSEPNVESALARETAKISRRARLRRVAESLGTAARVDPLTVLPRLLPLIGSDVGDEEQAKLVRLAMLDALEKAVSPDLLRDLIPVTYTALLSGDALVRAAGINLWAACARAADGSLPDEFGDLAATMLADPYVVVHKRMLRRLRELRLPRRLAPQLVEIVGGWAQTYRDNEEVLENAVWDLRYLARQLNDAAQTLAWEATILTLATGLSPYHRRDLLTAEWPERLLASPLWTRVAVQTLACPELVDYYNRRHEPILSMLMSRPMLIAESSLEDFEAISDLHGPQFFWRALEPIELLQAGGRWSDAAAIAERVLDRLLPGREGEYSRLLTTVILASARHAVLLTQPSPTSGAIEDSDSHVRGAVEAFLAAHFEAHERGAVARLVSQTTAQVNASQALTSPLGIDPDERAARLEEASNFLRDDAGEQFASAQQRTLLAEVWRIAALLLRYDAAVRRAESTSSAHLQSARRNAEVLIERVTSQLDWPNRAGLLQFLKLVADASGPSDTSGACTSAAGLTAPIRIVDELMPSRSDIRPRTASEHPAGTEEDLFAVCIASLRGAPVTDVIVVRPNEIYSLAMTVWLSSWPEWAESCVVEPLTTLSRDALSLPKFVFSSKDSRITDTGLLLEAQSEMYCRVEQPIGAPAIDCPILIRFLAPERDETVEVAGYRRLRLRPFDPSRDKLTEHVQTDQRLLAMFDRLSSPEYDTEDARAFCRLFAACVRAAQTIMFEKTFRKGTKVTETAFHDELERKLRADPELQGRLSRRDAVGGGFDDLLHDDVIAELKVARDRPVTIDGCARYLGQPTQYAVGRGSQVSVLVVLDHSTKEEPPGVIDNYMDWLQPDLHGLNDPRYPSMVGVLVVNTNLPVPSEWSRRRTPRVSSGA